MNIILPRPAGVRLRGRLSSNVRHREDRPPALSSAVATRVQLTLFLSGSAAERIEAVRRVLDPVQFKLIPAHVTLCREDELEGLSPALLQQRLKSSGIGPLTLGFGFAEEFNTHGVLVPCISGEEKFRALREAVLGTSAIRLQQPHITLAHPRNPKAPGNNPATAIALGSALKARFVSVCRIQQDGGAPWQVLQRFPLPAAEGSDA